MVSLLHTPILQRDHVNFTCNLGLVANLADWSAWEGHGSWVPLSTLGYPKSPKSWGTKLHELRNLSSSGYRGSMGPHVVALTVAVTVLDHGYNFTTKRWNPGYRTKPRLAGTSLSTTPVLLCTTKYYSSTTLYYKVLVTSPVLLCTTPVLLCVTTKYQVTTPVLYYTTYYPLLHRFMFNFKDKRKTQPTLTIISINCQNLSTCKKKKKHVAH